MEKWKIIFDYPNYSVSTHSRIRNNETGRILKKSINSDGYLTVHLYNNNGSKTFKTHTLIARYFLEKDITSHIIHHIDHNRANDNINNLKWVSYSENGIMEPTDNRYRTSIVRKIFYCLKQGNNIDEVIERYKNKTL